jgi:predicted lysophospholipase L1 biosynthesis ABC-type transport system permease subunit
VSIDKEFAADLWITIWDQILFNSAWLEINLIVVNIRKAVRSGASPFFYFSVFSADFEKYPKRYFISYKSQDKAENIQFEYSQAVWGDVTFINAKEIIAIVLDVTNKVLLIIYFCLAYVTIFSFLTFLVSISFLKSFKNAKLSLMHILWGQKKKLSKSVIFEYIYLMFFGLSISVALWSLWLYLLGYYIEYFTIDIISFIQWLWLVIWLLCIMSLYLFVSQKKND